MKKIILAALCLLCVIMTLTACQAKPSLKNLYEGKYVNTKKVVSSAEGLTIETLKGNGKGFLLTQDGENYAVYDTVAGKTVYENSYDEDDYTVQFSAYEVEGARVFCIQVETKGDDKKYISELYDADGTKIASAEGRNAMKVPATNCDLLSYNDVIYHCVKNKLEKRADVATLGNHFADLEKKVGKYYYASSATGFSIYDEDCVFYDIYTFPQADVSRAFPLKNGNVLIQVEDRLPSDADSYDYFDGKDKKNIETYLYKVNSRQTVKLSIKYIFYAVTCITEENLRDMKEQQGISLRSSIENIAVVARIKNRLLERTETMVLTNGGAFRYDISKMYRGSTNMPEAVAENLFRYTTDDGQTFYVDQRGKLVRDISTVDDVSENYIVADGKLYTDEYKLLYYFKDSGLSAVKLYDDGLILKTNSGVYYRATAESCDPIEHIAKGNVVRFEDAYYTVTDSGGKTAIYAPDGTLIPSSCRGALTKVCEYENKTLLSYIDVTTGKTKYVLLTLKSRAEA